MQKQWISSKYQTFKYIYVYHSHLFVFLVAYYWWWTIIIAFFRSSGFSDGSNIRERRVVTTLRRSIFILTLLAGIFFYLKNMKIYWWQYSNIIHDHVIINHAFIIKNKIVPFLLDDVAHCWGAILLLQAMLLLMTSKVPVQAGRRLLPIMTRRTDGFLSWSLDGCLPSCWLGSLRLCWWCYCFCPPNIHPS